MFFASKKSNKLNNRKNVPSHDSFLIDLRQPKTYQVREPKKKLKLIKRKLKLKNNKQSFSKKISSFNLSGYYCEKKPLTRKKKNNSFYARLNLLKIDLKFLKSVNYRAWCSRRKFNFEHILIKDAKNYFKQTHYSSWLDLKRKRQKKLKEEIKKDYLLTWYRSVFSFIIVLLLIILPFKILAYFKVLDLQNLKSQVMGKSFSALNNLVAATDEASDLSWDEAMTYFSFAARDFSAAQEELSNVDDWLFSFAGFTRNSDIRMAASSKKILAAGVAAADFGRHLSAAGSVFDQTEEEKSWGSLIDSFVINGELALISAQDLDRELQSINKNTIPLDYREQFISFQNQASLIKRSLGTLLKSAQNIKSFLGVSHDKRYLLVFQNNTEMRGSGGFLGSYALVDIRDGMIRKLEVPAGGTYDTEAGMRSFIKSPRPLWLVSPRWYFWDANWWPDWPTTARSLMWFYEKSDGPSVDGVISFTPDVLEDLLRISGEIDLEEEYGLIVDADNFWETIQAVVEKPNLLITHPDEVSNLPDSPDNQPKKIIGDLMFEIMNRLPQVLTADNLPELLSALEKNLGSKNIMMYFKDPDLQEQLVEYHLDASIKDSPHDYLMITHTNIAGQKSDRKMLERVTHDAKILNDGSIVNVLTIYRTHSGLKNQMLTGVRNVDWLRVYVPKNSFLISATGFQAPDSHYFKEPEDDWDFFPLIAENEETATVHLGSDTKIYTENDKTVFANWIMTDPGETSIIQLVYRLPFKLKEHNLVDLNWKEKLQSFLAGETNAKYPYSLLVQKQPGARPIELELSLTWPDFFRQIWLRAEKTAWDSTINLDRDVLQAIILEKNNL